MLAGLSGCQPAAGEPRASTSLVTERDWRGGEIRSLLCEKQTDVMRSKNTRTQSATLAVVAADSPVRNCDCEEWM